MNRKSLGILAIVIIALMAIVAVADLDGLPRSVENAVAATVTRISTDRSQFDQQRTAIDQALRAEPALFRTRAATWQAQIGQAQSRMNTAQTELASVKKLTEEDKRESARKIEEGLARIESLRAGSLQQVKEISAEAERWLGYKRNLPAQIQAMTADYETVRAFNPEAATAAARKAMTDWPAKRADLESRLSGIAEVKDRAEQTWTASAVARAQAGSGDSDQIDYPALFASADQLDQLDRQSREGSEAINQLAGQLYVNWDKLLLDVDEDKQKLRFVRTRYPDATLQNGAITQEEKWENIDRAQAEQLERNVGMVIARKPAGKYDSEAETGAQAPGYAYVAPPGQANAYGSWNNGVWSWLPQYLLLSHMLRGSSVPPIGMGDYGSYQSARRRGDVFYGHSQRQSSGSLRRAAERARASSSGGGFWKERQAPRATDGYRGSRYQNRGSYSGSRYSSPSGGGFRSYSRGMGGFRRGGRR